MAPTSVFLRLPPSKQRSVLAAAAAEFAQAGFSAAKVDAIAARAGISVGSLYQYFGTKENCFLSVLDDGVTELQARLDEVLTRFSDPWERIGAVLRLIPGHSRRHGAVLRLYYEIGGEGLSDRASDFCRRFEGLSARIYSTLLAEARSAGAVRADLDERYAAFCLDNILVTLQFSFSCDYHRLRKEVYLGTADDDDRLVEQVLRFLRYGLAGA